MAAAQRVLDVSSRSSAAPKSTVKKIEGITCPDFEEPAMSRLTLNYFSAPDPISGPRDGWIDYLRDVLADCSREDIGDAYSNNDAYPISDYAPAGKSGLLKWLNTSVDRLQTAHNHVDFLRPQGLMLDGQPAVLVVSDAEDFGASTASEDTVAFALLAWIVTERQCQDRRAAA